MEQLVQFPAIGEAIVIPAFSLFGFEIGPLPIRYYAIAYIAGLLLGWRVIVMMLRRQTRWPGGVAPLRPEQAEDLLFWTTIAVVLGGRFGFALFYDPGMFVRFPDFTTLDVFGLFEVPFPEVVAIWRGGMAFHGGMLGVAVSVWLFARAYGAPVLQVADAVAVATPIGLFFGRIANFINGELWGRHTEMPWGMVFVKVPAIAEQYPQAGLLIDGVNAPRHPSQLYEAALEGALLFAALAYMFWRTDAAKKPGLIAGVFLLGYGLARGFVEFFRQWNVELGLDFHILGVGISRGQILCAPMIIAGALLIYAARKRHAARGAPA